MKKVNRTIEELDTQVALAEANRPAMPLWMMVAGDKSCTERMICPEKFYRGYLARCEKSGGEPEGYSAFLQRMADEYRVFPVLVEEGDIRIIGAFTPEAVEEYR